MVSGRHTKVDGHLSTVVNLLSIIESTICVKVDKIDIVHREMNSWRHVVDKLDSN